MTVSGTADGAIEWAVAWGPYPGERECGDLHLVMTVPDGVLVAVVDGLGHGGAAAEAARRAVAAVRGAAARPLAAVFADCHAELRPTRGAAVSVARVDARTSTLEWFGVGNVAGVLARAQSPIAREHMIVQPGIVGYRSPPIRASRTHVASGDMLVMATDGVSPAFSGDVHPGHEPRRLAAEILACHRSQRDDALALAARYLGGQDAAAGPSCAGSAP